MIDKQDIPNSKIELQGQNTDNDKELKTPKKAIPQGVQELFNIFFRLQPRHENKPSFNAYQAQFQLDKDTIQKDLKIQDIVGHTYLGLAISKSSDTMAALELVMEPSPEYIKEISSIENIVGENIDDLQDLLEDDVDERVVTEKFKDMVLDSFDEELTKPKYVKDLLATLDDKDWYHLALQYVEINNLHDSKIDTLKDGVRKELKSFDAKTKYITKEAGDAILKPLREATDADLKATEDEIVKELLRQYKPVLRANKVLEFRRMNIMLEWFSNNIDKLQELESLPELDVETKEKLEALTSQFSSNIGEFITDPKSEKSKQESRQYLMLSKQVYSKFGKLMKEYIQLPEAKEAIAQGLEDTIDKKATPQNIKLIIKEYLRQFEALS